MSKIDDEFDEEFLHRARQAMRTTPIEVQKVLVLSTGHITPETLDDLDGRTHEELPFSGGRYSDYGWFMWSNDDARPGTTGEGYGMRPDLWAIMIFANQQGCRYVLLDCDADTTPELPIYEHD